MINKIIKAKKRGSSIEKRGEKEKYYNIVVYLLILYIIFIYFYLQITLCDNNVIISIYSNM